MRRSIQIAVLALAALCGGAAAAAESGSMTVEVNQSRRIVLPGVAASIVVGDPALAGVSMVDTHGVIVIGRGFGHAQLVVTDHAGRTLLDDEVEVVSADRGHVTLYRGVAVSDYACAGSRCHPQARPAGGSGGAAGAADVPQNPVQTTMTPP